jgi:hypothetical protein
VAIFEKGTRRNLVIRLTSLLGVDFLFLGAYDTEIDSKVVPYPIKTPSMSHFSLRRHGKAQL